MNERARDLDAPRLPAGQRANFFVDPLGKAGSAMRAAMCACTSGPASPCKAA